MDESIQVQLNDELGANDGYVPQFDVRVLIQLVIQLINISVSYS